MSKPSNVIKIVRCTATKTNWECLLTTDVKSAEPKIFYVDNLLINGTVNVANPSATIVVTSHFRSGRCTINVQHDRSETLSCKELPRR